VSALAERFPNATLKDPLDIKHDFNIFTPDGRMVASSGGYSSNVKDTHSANVDNARAIVHAVNTYDARDEALQKALEAFREAEWGGGGEQESCCPCCGETSDTKTVVGHHKIGCALRLALAKIEAALAVKS
jgi:hypothetical protein